MKKKRQQSYEVYNHQILWGVAERNLRRAISSQKKDKMFYALGAMLLLFFAFEGYLNWLGNRIAPEVWEEERQFFSRPPYQGTLGKYRFLIKVLRLPTSDTSRGPFQTAKRLLDLRRLAVHPKAEAGDRAVEIADGSFPPCYRGKLEREVSNQKAIQARDHVARLAEDLHMEAKSAYPDLVWEEKAFGPLLGRQITDV